MPANNKVSAAGSMSTFAVSLNTGQVNSPFSNRFAATHTPLPSQQRIFTRLFSLLVKTNRALWRLARCTRKGP